MPKFMPRIVTVLPPDDTEFSAALMLERTGESYEKPSLRVPTTAATVTMTDCLGSEAYADGPRHRSIELANHDVV